MRLYFYYGCGKPRPVLIIILRLHAEMNLWTSP